MASTIAYVLLYLLLRGAMAAQAANALSLLATAVANTAVNRRFTFGVRGRLHAVRHQARGLLAFGAGLLLTSAALAALHAVSARPGRGAEVTVLLGANLLATIVRFALYRSWVFRARRTPPPPSDTTIFDNEGAARPSGTVQADLTSCAAEHTGSAR